MSTVTDIEWEASVLEPTQDAELEGFVRQTLGYLPPMVTYFYSCPWVVRSMVAFEPSLWLAHFDVEFARVIDLVVSQDNSCRYCYAASRAMLKLLGIGEGLIQQLERSLFTTYRDAKAAQALEFVRSVSRANPLPSAGEIHPLLSAGYTEQAVREMAFCSATCVFYNRLSTLPALPTASIERLDNTALGRLQILLARLLKPAPRRMTTHAVDPDTLDMPFAYIVRAFAGLPLSAALSNTLAEAWRSGPLPRRAKALIFAVVARALGCPISERESVRLLANDGLDDAEVDQILKHLASPALDRLEAAIVPFARETIWYRPALLQRRTRELHAVLSHEQFLELVGIVALANAVCRMNVVLALP